MNKLKGVYRAQLSVAIDWSRNSFLFVLTFSILFSFFWVNSKSRYLWKKNFIFFAASFRPIALSNTSLIGKRSLAQSKLTKLT